MSFSPAAGLLIAMVATAPALLALGTAPPPEPGDRVIVIAPPWRAAAEIVDQAGGVLLLEGRFTNIASSYAPDGDHTAALRAGGAWAELSGDFTRFFLREPTMPNKLSDTHDAGLGVGRKLLTASWLHAPVIALIARLDGAPFTWFAAA